MRLLLLLLASPAWCWRGHHAITHAALEGQGYDNILVDYETLDAYLAAVGKTRDSFLKELKLNPTSPLWQQAGESPGKKLSLRDVISVYSDEPDQTMDADIFKYFPELWKDDYNYMGGKIPGEANRIWRHMYWPGGFLKPGGNGAAVSDPNPLGEAPNRSKVFYDLAVSAFKNGHPYWGGRFLGWALHYVQDVTEPFHSTQLPSMRLVRWGEGFKLDVEATVRVIGYYHYGHESAAAKILDGTVSAGQAQAKLKAALASKPAAPAAPPKLVQDAAAASAARSKAAANTCIALFLPLPADFSTFDPVAAVDSKAFWDAVQDGLSNKPEIAAPFVDLLVELLGNAGAATRSLVLQAKNDAAPPPAPAPDAGR